MKIFYLTNARLPTEKAHGLATIKLCDAFAESGADVTVLAPRRVNPLQVDVYPVRMPPTPVGGNYSDKPMGVNALIGRTQSARSNGVYEYYRAKRNFKICFLPSLDFLWLGFGQRFFFLIQLFSFSIAAALWLRLRYGLTGGLKDAVIFSHDHIPLFFASFFAPKIFYDIHDYPEKNFLYRRVLRKAAGFAVQTRWKIKKLGQDFGVPESKIVYWPNGVDIGRFDIAVSSAGARAKLGLPQDKKIVLYAGSLQKWKGAETLIRASGFLPDDAVVYVVGGGKKEVANFQFFPRSQSDRDPGAKRLGTIFNFQTRNIVFTGQKPWFEIPLWLKAADVLILPNTGQEEISLHYTSPMKLFEYMASGRPIAASNIPSIREVVDESLVWFAEPDNPRSFAAVIREILSRPEEASRRAAKAKEESLKYTWGARAQKILDIFPKVG